jgi:hypothetical protein
VPDQEPDIAANGLLDACTGLAIAAKPRTAAAAAAVRTDFARALNSLLLKNMTVAPLVLIAMIGSRKPLKKGSSGQGLFG